MVFHIWSLTINVEKKARDLEQIIKQQKIQDELYKQQNKLLYKAGINSYM